MSAGFDLSVDRFGGRMGRLAERCLRMRSTRPEPRPVAIANRIVGAGWCAFGIFAVLLSIMAVFGRDPR